MTTARSDTGGPSGTRARARGVPPWAPLVWFAVVAVVLSVVVGVVVRSPGPLDQRDPAYQRDGLLLDGPKVDETVAGVAFGGRPVVLLFVRDLPQPSALRQWAAQVPRRADVRLVVPEPPATRPPVPTVVDSRGVLAAAVGMPTPVDGGRPVGYAVVGSDRVVRYATLDPVYLRNAFEVATVVGAVR